MARRILWLAAVLLLASCGGGVKHDGPPRRDVDVSKIPDAVPRFEPITKAGNKSPYVVLGKKYYVMPTFENYQARGLASWYGTKFHGRTTSNGEVYDMYAMTAAHKTLPIPCYVQVTNLDNGRKIIVRINDRGPFMDDRIIDLSYAAAKKLGIDQTGTGRVHVAAITPGDYQRNAVEAPTMARAETPRRAPVPSAAGNGSAFLQVGAFSSSSAAEDYRRRASRNTGYPVLVNEVYASGKTLFKVLVGPFADHGNLLAAKDILQSRENLPSFVVYH
ncbi:MAG: septal ring lytic transglycosylase RlpA family protein [Porticoccaceae bacterium]